MGSGLDSNIVSQASLGSSKVRTVSQGTLLYYNHHGKSSMTKPCQSHHSVQCFPHPGPKRTWTLIIVVHILSGSEGTPYGLPHSPLRESVHHLVQRRPRAGPLSAEEAQYDGSRLQSPSLLTGQEQDFIGIIVG